MQLQIINYILYENDKPIREIFDTNIQLIRTCLVLNWNQDKKMFFLKEAPYIARSINLELKERYRRFYGPENIVIPDTNSPNT